MPASAATARKRTVRYVRVFWQLSDKPLLARIWSHGVRGAKRNGWSKIKRWAPSWRIGVAQLAIGVAAVVGSFEFNRAALAIALAENEEWMAVHIDKTIQRRNNCDNRTALVGQEEQILKCLGAAVLMRGNTVPTKLQRKLFDCASSIGDLQQTTPLKGRIARFIHNHKNDQQKSD